MNSVRLWIFDVDGTLVNSNDAHALAWERALADHGKPVAFGVLRRLIGMGSDHLLPTATGIAAESPLGKQIAAHRGEIFQSTFLPTLQAFPGCRTLFEKIRAGDGKIAIASSAKKDELTQLLRIAEVEDLVDAVTSSDDAERSKPDADIVSAALHKTHFSPNEAVMIGDTPYDIEAAKRAHVRAIAVRTGGWPDEALRDAVAIYDDPVDLWRNLDRAVSANRPFRPSPPVQRASEV